MKPYLIHQYFDQAAARHPDKAAIRFQGWQLSYRELLQASNRIALQLRRAGVVRGDRVCALVAKSPAALAAMLGILKSDAIYVPLDADSPSLRVRTILSDCEPCAVLCGPEARVLLESYRQDLPKGFTIIEVQPDTCGLVGLPEEPSASELSDGEYLCIDIDIAYLIYTSGSSGTPKGVMISHLNLCNYIEWALGYFQIKSWHNILNTAPLHFDMAIFDIFGALASGATLTLAPKKAQLFPSKLIEILTADKITLWKAVASLLAYFVRTNSLRPKILPDLETVIFSGESLHPKYLSAWTQAFPDKRFYNAYGPTEATGISTCYEIKENAFDPRKSIPIGSACKNTEVFAITENGEIAKPGQCGELVIRGSGVSCGYWNNPEKTAQAFMHMRTPNGRIDRVYRTGDLVRHLQEEGSYAFIGRKDFQIKHFGYRIEPGEIEATLCDQPEVSDAAVVALDGVDRDAPEIIAFVEAAEPASMVGMMDMLRKRLSAYMIPHKLIRLKAMPRTGNGKIDRQRLKSEYLSSQPERGAGTSGPGR
jgi:D-alanine--poly(phosphoribitol) ligase subunit 1